VPAGMGDGREGEELSSWGRKKWVREKAAWKEEGGTNGGKYVPK